MEDRFKFRAFDTEKKVMIKNVVVEYESNSIGFSSEDLYNAYDENSDIYKRGKDGEITFIDTDKHPNLQEFEDWYVLTYGFIPMSCTGIMDINDHLIYEGDIVFDMDERSIHKVIWCNGSWCLDCGAEQLEYFISNTKIIGNIHENPELLEDK
ncbi:MAG: hypothetical protein GY804_02040 [Alphaproteobacteria bacterium]|nr:hypothetical protein [Alphaproteobacteria bacterium]